MKEIEGKEYYHAFYNGRKIFMSLDFDLLIQRLLSWWESVGFDEDDNPVSIVEVIQ